MATQKLQPTRALKVIPSENADIPNPNTYNITGTNTFAVSSNLVDSSANFIAKNVRPGDIVYNNTDGTAATVISVFSAQSLVLNAAIFDASGKKYTIYAMSPQSGIGNEGSVLYIGIGGNIKVTTSGNDIVTFVNIQDGTFFPINVLKVFSAETTATNIIALW